jgi:replicative DNA helicase
MPRGSDISPLSVLLRRVDSIAEGAPSPDTVPSGYPSVDRILGGGFRRGDLIVLGGDVGSGKSALALAFALRAAETGERVAFYSGEMGPERLQERLLAIEGRVPVDELRRGMLDEVGRAAVGAAAVRLRDRVPVLERLPDGGVESLAEVLDREGEIAMAVIDGLPALPAGRGAVAEEEANAIRMMKALALSRNCVILVTAPLSRLQPRDDPRPRLDDFGALGAIAHQSDVVLALFREEMYSSGGGVEGATELLVRKNRNGSTGYLDLYFYTQWMRFEDMLDPDR